VPLVLEDVRHKTPSLIFRKELALSKQTTTKLGCRPIHTSSPKTSLGVSTVMGLALTRIDRQTLKWSVVGAKILSITTRFEGTSLDCPLAPRVAIVTTVRPTGLSALVKYTLRSSGRDEKTVNVEVDVGWDPATTSAVATRATATGSERRGRSRSCVRPLPGSTPPRLQID
jgi:hypothetical protein